MTSSSLPNWEGKLHLGAGLRGTISWATGRLDFRTYTNLLQYRLSTPPASSRTTTTELAQRRVYGKPSISAELQPELTPIPVDLETLQERLPPYLSILPNFFHRTYHLKYALYHRLCTFIVEAAINALTARARHRQDTSTSFTVVTFASIAGVASATILVSTSLCPKPSSKAKLPPAGKHRYSTLD